jgi:hypothetical protein
LVPHREQTVFFPANAVETVYSLPQPAQATSIVAVAGGDAAAGAVTHIACPHCLQATRLPAYCSSIA